MAVSFGQQNEIYVAFSAKCQELVELGGFLQIRDVKHHDLCKIVIFV